MGRCRKSLQNAADWSVSEQLVEITHPFHPLRGKQVALLHKEKHDGQVLAVVRDAERTFKLPLSWTDAVPVDPFVLQSRGRAFFQPANFLAVADLACALWQHEV